MSPTWQFWLVGKRGALVTVRAGGERRHFSRRWPEPLEPEQDHWRGRGRDSTAVSKSASLPERKSDATTSGWENRVAAIVRRASNRLSFSRGKRFVARPIASGSGARNITKRKSPPIRNTARFARTVRASGAPPMPATGSNTGSSTQPPRNRTVNSRRAATGNSGCASLQTTPQLWT